MSPLDASGDVSVVIVAYREHGVLVACLASFEEHRPHRVGEVIVIDNTADGSGVAMPEQFPWVDYVANEENVHFRAANNQGARRARLPYLLLLNPDTVVVDTGSVAAMAGVLDRDPRVGFVGPLMRGEEGTIGPQGEPIPGIGELLAMKLRLNSVWPGNPWDKDRIRAALPPAASGPVPTVSAAALLCRREQYLAVGGLDERARAYYEEPELARKLGRLGMHGYYCAEASVRHLWRRGGSRTVDLAAQIAEFDEGLAAYYGSAYGWRGRALLVGLDAGAAALRAVRRFARR